MHREEQLYNESHIRTRNTIERYFGVIKRRFPILAYGCRLKIDRVLTIIVATAVLHNLCIETADVDPPPIPEELDEHVLDHLIANGQIPEINIGGEPAGVGLMLRRQFINQYFSHL